MQQSVFISGAAQGIGAEIARLFHNHGYKSLLKSKQVFITKPS